MRILKLQLTAGGQRGRQSLQTAVSPTVQARGQRCCECRQKEIAAG